MAPYTANEASPTSPKTQSPIKRKESTTNGAAQQVADSKPTSRKDTKESQDAPKDSKPSGAELKKRAKEEKAARRAKEKQEKQPPSQPVVSIQDQQSHTANSDASVPDHAGSKQSAKQHKRAGSANTNVQKQLPIRTAEPQAAPTKSAPKKENKNVSIFSHLYGQPRRTSMAGAGKDIHPAVVTLGLKMSHYIICGSNARCVAMLLAFKRVIESYSTPPGNSLPRHLTTHLSSQIEYLVSCRPLSVSMGNAIRWLKVKISEVDPDTLEKTAKQDLSKGIDNFIQERITAAGQAIATSATERIHDGDVILTYARSSTVQQTLEEARSQGKSFRVIIADSRPLFEGKTLARRLVALGIEIQYCLLHAINHIMPDVTKVFLGAHAMMSNGRLYSRCGTALLAMTAKDADLPVIVCSESIKFSDRVALDSIAINEVAPPDELLGQDSGASPLSKWRDTPGLQLLNLMYDLTPAEYIDVVITEYGSLPPSSVPVVHRLSMNS